MPTKNLIGRKNRKTGFFFRKRVAFFSVSEKITAFMPYRNEQKPPHSIQERLLRLRPAIIDRNLCYICLSLFLVASSLLSSGLSIPFSMALVTDETGPFIFSCGSVLCKVSGSGFKSSPSAGCFLLMSASF